MRQESIPILPLRTRHKRFLRQRFSGSARSIRALNFCLMYGGFPGNEVFLRHPSFMTQAPTLNARYDYSYGTLLGRTDLRSSRELTSAEQKEQLWYATSRERAPSMRSSGGRYAFCAGVWTSLAEDFNSACLRMENSQSRFVSMEVIARCTRTRVVFSLVKEF